MPKPSIQRILTAVAAISAVAFIAMAMMVSNAEALSNPLTGGRNIVIKVNGTLRRIPATGQRCAVTLANVDVYYKQFPVFTGYGNTALDAGPLTTTGIPICDGTLTTAAACPVTTLVRDSVPDALWVQALTGFIPDGGIPLRVEEGTGCTAP